MYVCMYVCMKWLPTFRTDSTSESKGGAGDVGHTQSPIRKPFRGEEIGETKLSPVGVGEVAE